MVLPINQMNIYGYIFIKITNDMKLLHVFYYQYFLLYNVKIKSHFPHLYSSIIMAYLLSFYFYRLLIIVFSFYEKKANPFYMFIIVFIALFYFGKKKDQIVNTERPIIGNMKISFIITLIFTVLAIICLMY